MGSSWRIKGTLRKAETRQAPTSHTKRRQQTLAEEMAFAEVPRHRHILGILGSARKPAWLLWRKPGQRLETGPDSRKAQIAGPGAPAQVYPTVAPAVSNFLWLQHEQITGAGGHHMAWRGGSGNRKN